MKEKIENQTKTNVNCKIELAGAKLAAAEVELELTKFLGGTKNKPSKRFGLDLNTITLFLTRSPSVDTPSIDVVDDIEIALSLL